MATVLRMAQTLSIAMLACLAAGCFSTGGAINNTNLTRQWNGRSTAVADAQWGAPVSREPMPDARYTLHTWAVPGCRINAVVKDGYMSEVRARALEIDGCNIVYARSRTKDGATPATNW